MKTGETLYFFLIV